MTLLQRISEHSMCKVQRLTHVDLAEGYRSLCDAAIRHQSKQIYVLLSVELALSSMCRVQLSGFFNCRVGS